MSHLLLLPVDGEGTVKGEPGSVEQVGGELTPLVQDNDIGFVESGGPGAVVALCARPWRGASFELRVKLAMRPFREIGRDGRGGGEGEARRSAQRVK